MQQLILASQWKIHDNRLEILNVVGYVAILL